MIIQTWINEDSQLTVMLFFTALLSHSTGCYVTTEPLNYLPFHDTPGMIPTRRCPKKLPI